MLYVKCCGHALNLTYQDMIKYPQVTYKTLKTALKISDSHEMMAEAFKWKQRMILETPGI